MVAQLNLFENTVYDFLAYKQENKKKRVRAKYPCYIKVYSPYKYDHNKYRELFKPIIKKALDDDDPDVYWNTNPYDLLEKCIIRENGKKVRLVDECPHVFRYKTLYKIYEKLGQMVYKGQLKLDLGMDV